MGILFKLIIKVGKSHLTLFGCKQIQPLKSNSKELGLLIFTVEHNYICF